MTCSMWFDKSVTYNLHNNVLNTHCIGNEFSRVTVVFRFEYSEGIVARAAHK